MFKHIKTIFILLILLPLLLFLLKLDSLKYYINISLDIFELNNDLAVVSSNFYENPTDNAAYKDIIYKTRGDLDLTLDLYTSNDNSSSKSPVIIYVFGGAWIYGDKSLPTELSPIIETLRDEGFSVICTSYELISDDLIFEEQISDVKDTIRWVYKNKDIYNFDTDNIGLIGPSAGSQLSMVAAYSSNELFCGDPSLAEYPSDVSYVVDLFGPSQLSKINFSLAPKALAKKIADYDVSNISELYSPINYLKEDLPNTLIIHSKLDNIVPYSTSLDLYYEALKYNNDFKFITLESCNHYLENLSSEEAAKIYFEILSFIYINSST